MSRVISHKFEALNKHANDFTDEDWIILFSYQGWGKQSKMEERTLTNQMWFRVVCTLTDNKCRSSQWSKCC